MRNYRLSNEALNDIDDLWSFIAADNLDAADRLVRGIYDACALLGDNPSLGHSRRDLTTLPVRFYAVMKNYLIIYASDTSPVMVARVLHGARDVAALLIK